MRVAAQGRTTCEILRPPQSKTRHPKPRHRVPKWWTYEQHENRRCCTCALTHLGVRHFRGWGHVGHVRNVNVPYTPHTASRGEGWPARELPGLGEPQQQGRDKVPPSAHMRTTYM